MISQSTILGRYPELKYGKEQLDDYHVSLHLP